MDIEQLHAREVEALGFYLAAQEYARQGDKEMQLLAEDRCREARRAHDALRHPWREGRWSPLPSEVLPASGEAAPAPEPVSTTPS